MTDRSKAIALVAWIIALGGAVLSVLAGALVGGRAYVLTSVFVILFAMLPFFVQFERRRPQARELVVLAVLCALGVAARALFVWVPHFKPMAAIIMIAAIAFGRSSGFLVGAITVLASNFIFGQGPWTPWQMLAFGSCGYIFGLLAERGFIPRSHLSRGRLIATALAGGLFIVLVAGPILDTSTFFYFAAMPTPQAALAVYLAGFPVNCIQGASVAIALFLLANPLLNKLARLRTKYGFLTEGGRPR